MNKQLKMVDLGSQYTKIRDEINSAIHQVLEKTNFINGSDVEDFAVQPGALPERQSM